MRVELVTPRACAVLPVAMARLWLAHAPDVEQESRVLEQLVTETLAAWEARTDGHLLGLQTWRVWYDAAEVTDQWLLPLGPLVSVTSITSYDQDDAATVLGATNYQVVIGEYGYVTTTYDAVMPSSLRSRDAWAVLVTAGATGAKVPYSAADGTPGLDDMTASGTYTGATRALWEIEIDTAAATDKFKWRKIVHDRYGNRTLSSWTTGVSITGAAQALGADGVSVTFAAITGHTLADAWTIEAREAIDDDILLGLRGLLQFYHRSRGTGLIETVSGQLVSLPFNVGELIDRYRRPAINPFDLDDLPGVV